LRIKWDIDFIIMFVYVRNRQHSMEQNTKYWRKKNINYNLSHGIKVLKKFHSVQFCEYVCMYVCVYLFWYERKNKEDKKTFSMRMSLLMEKIWTTLFDLLSDIDFMSCFPSPLARENQRKARWQKLKKGNRKSRAFN
jgi:hypothetical protein